MRERDLNNTVTPNPKLAIDYCGIKMKNPIIAASGTFGNGPEYAGYLDLSNEVGAISVKGLTPKGRHGNHGTRIAETPSGVLNCIGLENPGAEHFVKEILPDIKKYDVPLLANMSAGTIDEFTWMAETLSVDGIAGLEQGNWMSLLDDCFSPEETGLPDYFIPFFKDESVYYCFDYLEKGKEPSIRLIDIEMDQWLTIASSFEELIDSMKPHIEIVDFDHRSTRFKTF